MITIIKEIFLDTNIYEENNFFQSSHIQSLFYYSKIGVINLYMTSISKMELIERMKKKLIESKDEHNNLIRTIDKKSRILKNLMIYNNFDKSSITVKESLAELTNKLETIINVSNIKIITAEEVNIESVFELFYNELPPFSSKEKKKYEFPDAFILKSIESWCKERKKKIIFLTKDNDFNQYKNTRIIFRNNLPELLQQITLYYDSLQKEKLIPTIIDKLEKNKAYILELIENKLNQSIIRDVDYENTSSLELSKPKFNSYKITSIRPGYSEITYYIEIKYNFTIFPSKIDIARNVFRDDLKPKKISERLIISCELEIDSRRIDLKWINSNQKIRISIV